MADVNAVQVYVRVKYLQVLRVCLHGRCYFEVSLNGQIIFYLGSFLISDFISIQVLKVCLKRWSKFYRSFDCLLKWLMLIPWFHEVLEVFWNEWSSWGSVKIGSVNFIQILGSAYIGYANSTQVLVSIIHAFHLSKIYPSLSLKCIVMFIHT